MDILELNQVLEVEGTICKIECDINAGNCVVFCGAGISKNSGLPIVNQLVPFILNKLELLPENFQFILEKDNSPKIPFESFMECIEEQCNPEILYDIYKQGDPNLIHIFLADLIKSGKLKTIVTTNFDKLIEKALDLAPNPLKEGIDYDIIYKDSDFSNIDWNNNRIRLIKIHGSIDDKQSIAITLKQVASKDLSKQRASIISNIFSNGLHNSVLILGYSSSDIFDISPQIQLIEGNFKKVYYVQHSDGIKKVDDIKDNEDKNPFKRFDNSFRLYYNTMDLIEKIWKSDTNFYKSSELYKGVINWKKNVENWYQYIKKKNSPSLKYSIIASVLFKMGNFKLALLYYENSLKIAKETLNKKLEYQYLEYIGGVHLRMGDYRKAIECIEKSKNILDQIELEIDEKMDNIKNPFLGLPEEEISKEFFMQFKNQMKEIRDINKEVEWLIGLGNAYISLGEYSKAVLLFEKSLNICRKNEYLPGEGVSLCCLSHIYKHFGEYLKAIDYIEKSVNIAINLGDKLNEGTRLGDLANIYTHLNEYDKALEIYEKALMIPKEIGDKHGEELLLGGIGNVFADKDHYNIAIEYFERALNLSQEIHDKQGECAWLGNIGRTYAKLEDYKKAIVYYGQSLDLSTVIGDKRNEAACLSDLGFANNVLGEYNMAFDNLKKALRYSKEIGDKRIEESCLGSLGNVYNNLNKRLKAIEYYNKALKIAICIGDKRNEMIWLNNIGNTFTILDKDKLSIDYLKKSLNISRNLGLIKNEEENLGDIGKVLDKTGDFKKANEYYENAIIIAKINKYNHQDVWLYQLGYNYYRLGEHNKALNYLRKALQIVQATGNKTNEGYLYGCIGSVYFHEGDFRIALRYFDQSLNILIPSVGYSHPHTKTFLNHYAITKSKIY